MRQQLFPIQKARSMTPNIICGLSLLITLQEKRKSCEKINCLIQKQGKGVISKTLSIKSLYGPGVLTCMKAPWEATGMCQPFLNFHPVPRFLTKVKETQLWSTCVKYVLSPVPNSTDGCLSTVLRRFLRPYLSSIRRASLLSSNIFQRYEIKIINIVDYDIYTLMDINTIT